MAEVGQLLIADFQSRILVFAAEVFERLRTSLPIGDNL